MVDSYITVVTQEQITCSTLLGPLPLSSGSPDSLTLLIWKCTDHIPASKQILKVSPKDQSSGRGISRIPTWLVHIQPARCPDEQNLEVVAKGGQLYYRAQRDISNGEELKAWFGQDLADLLRLPLLPPNPVEGEKYFECMMCQEKFEHPFPVIAHLMYKCQRRDNDFPVFNQIRRKSSSRVKNFDIATLTDMDDSKKEWENSNELAEVGTVKTKESNNIRQENKEIEVKKRKKKSDSEDATILSPHKFMKAATRAESESLRENHGQASDSEKTSLATQLSAFQVTESQNSVRNINSGDNTSSGDRSSSAFKKVNKSTFSHATVFSPSLNSMSNLLTNHRELLFQGGGNFAAFPYHIPSTVGSPVTCTLPQSLTSAIPHPSLSSPNSPTEVHISSAFGYNPKVPHSLSSLSNQQIKMNEEFRMLRQSHGGEGNFEISAMSSGIRIPTMHGLNYASKPPLPQSMDSFSSKSFPTPLLPFLPPSLAALSFPTQNWCAKCNASFRMTSDLVYHMRSHHKKETDPQKIKREEKLRCNICHESFRERHHLTRHMTSHQ